LRLASVRRRKARSLRDELAGVERAPFASSYCKAQARQHVERLAERGKPDVAALIRFDEDIAWPKENVRSQVYTEPQRALAFAELVDPVSILAWLDPAKLIAKLDAEIDRVSDDKHALSVEAREMKAAELQTALLEIERQESALVWTAQQQNLPCEHRADCAPAAILGVALLTASRTNRSTGTSPMHAYDIVGQPGARR